MQIVGISPFYPLILKRLFPKNRTSFYLTTGGGPKAGHFTSYLDKHSGCGVGLSLL